jgi:hypothetical protein
VDTSRQVELSPGTPAKFIIDNSPDEPTAMWSLRAAKCARRLMARRRD